MEKELHCLIWIMHVYDFMIFVISNSAINTFFAFNCSRKRIMKAQDIKVSLNCFQSMDILIIITNVTFILGKKQMDLVKIQIDCLLRIVVFEITKLYLGKGLIFRK